MNRRALRLLSGSVAAGAVLAAAYPALFRRRCLQWGARPDEVARIIPGDDLVAFPDLTSTRAITIEAPPEAIWPWLVQMGSGRAGAYTYDWIENLFGLDMHSAEEIVPEWQNLAVGDVLPLGDNGPRMRVERLEPGRLLVLFAEDGDWVWQFALHPEDDVTRLISRNIIDLPRASLARRLMMMYVLEPGSLVMERKMLLGIKRRAERTFAVAGLPGDAGDTALSGTRS